MLYTVMRDGYRLGVYDAATPLHALDLYAQEADYDDFANMISWHPWVAEATQAIIDNSHLQPNRLRVILSRSTNPTENLMQAVQQILTDDQIRTYAPSAFAATAHGSRSGRYAFIPTSKVISAMRAEGFMPVFASQSRCRKPDREGYAKHMLRFRRESTLDIEARAIGDVSAEVVLVNSHDGSTLYHLMAGLFRLWCLNGAVSQIGTDTDLKVAHTGKAIDALIEGSYKVIESARVALDHAKHWNRIQLSPIEVHDFATAAARLRFDPETQPVTPWSLIAPRREQDTGNDLWTVFNRAQESLIRGGQQYTTVTRRLNTTRAVTGIDQSIKLNRALWTLGEEVAQRKAA